MLSTQPTYCSISDKCLSVRHHRVDGSFLVILPNDDGNRWLLGSFNLYMFRYNRINSNLLLWFTFWPGSVRCIWSQIYFDPLPLASAWPRQCSPGLSAPWWWSHSLFSFNVIIVVRKMIWLYYSCSTSDILHPPCEGIEVVLHRPNLLLKLKFWEHVSHWSLLAGEVAAYRLKTYHILSMCHEGWRCCTHDFEGFSTDKSCPMFHCNLKEKKFTTRVIAYWV